MNTNTYTTQEVVEAEHIQYLKEIKESGYKPYQDMGISFSDFLIIWNLNRIQERLVTIEELLADDSTDEFEAEREA